jgi:cell division transport system ATP-binding protein
VLSGDLPFREGQGNVAGFNLNGLKKKDIPHLRRKIGIVSEENHLLFDRSAEENLLFSMKATGERNKEKMRRRAWETICLVGLPDAISKNPRMLSGGEKRRLCIARALLNQPPLLILDEPTSNLDRETGEEIVRLLRRLAESGTTILMATHDERLTEKFPAKMLRIQDGTVRVV